MKITSRLLVFTLFTSPLLFGGKGDEIIKMDEMNKLIGQTEKLSIEVNLDTLEQKSKENTTDWHATEFYFKNLFGEKKDEHKKIIQDTLTLISQDEKLTKIFNTSLETLVNSYDIREESDKLDDLIKNLDVKGVENLLKKYIDKIQGSVKCLKSIEYKLDLLPVKTRNLIDSIANNTQKKLEAFEENSSLKHESLPEIIMKGLQIIPGGTGLGLMALWTAAIIFVCIKLVQITEVMGNYAGILLPIGSIVGSIWSWLIGMGILACCGSISMMEGDRLERENKYFYMKLFGGDTEKRIEIKKMLRDYLKMVEKF